ncbi:hypothetical protein [Pedosphaera parvula]|uniref:Uncharacterized protein n=1 Tax=Pedosphaera parvula (strain Ellin514) TaxID=320771 RepID=B9XAD2_PEDPL|nr:hypothetical protein [Pedosphaera parvula]EEF63473.1 hypothetical protein Cflav_PD6108 [Pedosphaera parvula Ellin514]
MGRNQMALYGSYNVVTMRPISQQAFFDHMDCQSLMVGEGEVRIPSVLRRVPTSFHHSLVGGAGGITKGEMNLLTSIPTRVRMVVGWKGSWATCVGTFLGDGWRGEGLIRLTPDATRVNMPGGWIGIAGRVGV